MQGRRNGGSVLRQLISHVTNNSRPLVDGRIGASSLSNYILQSLKASALHERTKHGNITFQNRSNHVLFQTIQTILSNTRHVVRHGSVGSNSASLDIVRQHTRHRWSQVGHGSTAAAGGRGRHMSTASWDTAARHYTAVAREGHARLRSMWGHWEGYYRCGSHSQCLNLYLPPLARAVGTASLACARYQVVPRFLALVLGEATWAEHNIAAAAEAYREPSLISRMSWDVPLFLVAIKALLMPALETVILMFRAAYLMMLFTPALILAPFAEANGGEFRKFWLHLVHRSLELAGAAFIKWGQWAATRPDLFPQDLCRELARLQTKAPAHSFAQTKRSIERAFGMRLSDIFDEFEEEPVASGSIAQVHRAVLKRKLRELQGVKVDRRKPSTLVAVKVRHPGVSDIIRRDFAIINWVAKISTFVPGLAWLRLDESIQQFAVFMLTQVDLAREAAHLSRFIYNFRAWKDVSFPRPLYPLVHPAVLVETYERGESVARFVERPERDYVNSALAHIGTHTLLKMLLVDNFIHADLHPGNILVRMERGTSPFNSRPHVILLDVGMTAELSIKDRKLLVEFFKAIAYMNGRDVGECTLKFSRDQTCPEPEAFIRDVEQSFKAWSNAKPEDFHAGDCMQDLLEHVRKHHVNIDGDVCTVIVTTLVLEGWQRKLDPDLNLMNTLKALLIKSDWATSLSDTIDGLMAA